MPVIDASVVVSYLGGAEADELARQVLFDAGRTRWVPHLIDAEVGHALRRAVATGRLEAAHAGQALDDLVLLPIVRAGHTGLVQRAWELRENVSFYDALYVALAERIGCELITLDARLARAASSLIDVVVLGE